MTGFGDARAEGQGLVVAVEIRTVNNRYLKIMVKCSDTYAPLEAEIERVVRESISRGTVNLTVKIAPAGGEDFRLNELALRSYWRQLLNIADELQSPPPDLGRLLLLPGVVGESDRGESDLGSVWKLVEQPLRKALTGLRAFRQEEGRQMERELIANVDAIGVRLADIVTIAPQVVAEFRNRIHERVQQLLSGENATVSNEDLIREVSIFADRSDINEEITRLKCHLDQFRAFVQEPTSAGRKLDFLTQEMFREVNTIGSKANNVSIAHAVVDMKAAVEKIREILQNVE
jgi:uncharacterized protein (TIGR00255 family)